jgi:hypothetical protein
LFLEKTETDELKQVVFERLIVFETVWVSLGLEGGIENLFGE